MRNLGRWMRAGATGTSACILFLAAVPSCVPFRSHPGTSEGKGQQGVRALPRSAPDLLRIPAIGVRTRLLSVGTTPGRAVATPPMSRPWEAAWYRDGPSPGERGSAVLLGHVDTTQGPAVFFHLHALTPGSRIHVTRADGRTGTFAVTSHRYVSKARFPAGRVFAREPRPVLRLITCAPPYDQQRREYLNNLIVSARLIRTTPARPGPGRPTMTPPEVPERAAPPGEEGVGQRVV